ncbi:MAG: SprB repeat-containing protein [Bacteroidia bacterium]|nr:SprB repeat-containing protein [Bacteroidia bacterium]
MKKTITLLALTMLIYIDVVRGQTVTVWPTNVSCNGVCDGSATANVSGGSLGPFEYYWSNGQSGPSAPMYNLCAGTYTVTVKNNGSPVGTASVTITEPPPINITTTVINATNCKTNASGITTNVSGGTGAYTYSWSTGSTGIMASNLGCSTYTLSVNDANGCIATTAIVVSDVIGIEKYDKEFQLQVSPNPSNGNFTVKSGMALKKCVGMDVLGNIVYSDENIQSTSFDISLSQLSNGIYFFKVTNVPNIEQVCKVVVEH